MDAVYHSLTFGEMAMHGLSPKDFYEADLRQVKVWVERTTDARDKAHRRIQEAENKAKAANRY